MTREFPFPHKNGASNSFNFGIRDARLTFHVIVAATVPTIFP
jgi:hypothetical protein